MMLTIRPSVPRDAAVLAAVIREKDLIEYRATTGLRITLGDAMTHLYERLRSIILTNIEGFNVVTVDSPKGLVAVGGWDSQGNVWFLCSGIVEEYPKEFLKLVRKVRDELLKDCNVLTNCYMVANELHGRFLKALGAEFSQTTTERGGSTFQRFYISKEVNHV